MTARNEIKELCHAHDYILARIRRIEPDYLPSYKFINERALSADDVERVRDMVKCMEFRLGALLGASASMPKAGKDVALALPPPRDPPRPPHHGGDDPKNPHPFGGSSMLWESSSDLFKPKEEPKRGQVRFITEAQGTVRGQGRVQFVPESEPYMPPMVRALGIRPNLG